MNIRKSRLKNRALKMSFMAMTGATAGFFIAGEMLYGAITLSLSSIYVSMLLLDAEMKKGLRGGMVFKSGNLTYRVKKVVKKRFLGIPVKSELYLDDTLLKRNKFNELTYNVLYLAVKREKDGTVKKCGRVLFNVLTERLLTMDGKIVSRLK